MTVIDKPWGTEEILESNDKYVVKRIYMEIGKKCSLQYHERKKETIFVLVGSLEVDIGESVNNLKTIIVNTADGLTLDPGDIHRMKAVEEDCIYLEMSTPELDDVIRLEDDYGRV